MISFKNKSEILRFNFFGICFIQCTNSSNFIKKFIMSDESEIEINNNIINKKDLIIITKMTRRLELIDLTKNSFIYKEITNFLSDKNIINNDILNEIKNRINDNDENIDIIDVCDGDLFKIINQLFSLNDNEYIDKLFFKYILNNSYNDSKKTFVLVDCDFISISDLIESSNNHNFIFVTYNMFNNITHINEIDNLILYNDISGNSIQIDDINVVINYIELNSSRNFDNNYILEIKNSITEQLNIISNLYKLV